MTDVSAQEFLDILTDPDKHYLREGNTQFKGILCDKMFDYKAEFTTSQFTKKFRYCIEVTADDQDSLDDLDKYFILCFANVMQLVDIVPIQFSDQFMRRYFIRKDFRRG